MRSVARLSTALLAAALMAGELDRKLLPLIGPDAWLVFGIDVERYRNSSFAKLYPLGVERLSAGTGIDAASQISQLVTVSGEKLDGRVPLTIFRSAVLPAHFQPQGDECATTTSYQGISIVSISEYVHVARLDTTTGMAGDPDSVREAVDRWRHEQTGSGGLGTKLQQLSGTYDAWFLALKPLAKLHPTRAAPRSRYRKELMEMVEEARGGIRLGGFSELTLEVVTKTPDDAAALAALGRWLPGLVQLDGSQSRESALADLAENVVVRANGSVVSISFVLAESGLEELVKSLKAMETPEP